ncbi:MAG: VanZ family protein [Isosphaeraceae bacterium]
MFLLDLTLLRFPASRPGHNAIPFRSVIHDWRSGGSPFVWNFVGNLVAFLPFGMIPSSLRWRRTGVGPAAAFSLACSALIESIQYLSGRRVADVDDLILNTAGGMLGYGLLTLCARLMRLRRERGARARA